ncbi:hypothetical protein UVI_02041100 [Ustilaginoidea virens]|uniref:DUF1479 domain protein n=1 Tax=Ustilaginoidea virens TaxID=1159556 RepID=A0A1B5KWG8_USTVR|nr:hypothetical protein UVI_02041100 [Ustilaginoidea virens]
MAQHGVYLYSWGSDVIPQVEFAHLEAGCRGLRDEIRKRGVIVVRGVVPEGEARAYKDEVEEYVRRNPWTRAFPPDDPQVYELYWSAPQLKARSHPSVLRVQHHLLADLWHTSSAAARISLQHPLSYADRLRIRQPGDASFALGPHMDGGSVERWEPDGYGRGGVYDKVLEGSWGDFDPWDASGRVDAVTNLYDGLGACSVFRAWQGWLSMSRSGPREGTLLVNPLVRLATAYVLLRPFFAPLSDGGPGFLDESNWAFVGEAAMTSELHGASPGHAQELTDALHPHLELARTMVHVPLIKPGDFVAWHGDTIHSVDAVHRGSGDSSVMYIPVCPVTDTNAAYLARQRQAFRDGTPAPDFPGGEGERRHAGRPTEGALRRWADGLARQALGLERIQPRRGGLPGETEAIAGANAALGF